MLRAGVILLLTGACLMTASAQEPKRYLIQAATRTGRSSPT
ncbi:MAG: hypothetical protein ACOCX2_14540 [Armatimonadota bacterium]